MSTVLTIPPRPTSANSMNSSDKDNNRHESVHRKLQRAYQEKNLMLAQIQYLKKQVNQPEKLPDNEVSLSPRVTSPLSIQTDTSTDKESWNRLLEANIRAGTIACLWCLKTLLIKKLSVAFHRWKYNTSSAVYNAKQIENNQEIQKFEDTIKQYSEIDDRKSLKLDTNVEYDNMVDNYNSDQRDDINNEESYDGTENYERKREMLLSYANNVNNVSISNVTIPTKGNKPQTVKSPRYLSPTIAFSNQINPLTKPTSKSFWDRTYPYQTSPTNQMKNQSKFETKFEVRNENYDENFDENKNDNNDNVKFKYINDIVDKDVINYLNHINENTNGSIKNEKHYQDNKSNNNRSTSISKFDSSRRNSNKLPNYLAPTRSSHKKIASPRNMKKEFFSRSMSLNQIPTNYSLTENIQSQTFKSMNNMDKYVIMDNDSNEDKSLSELTNEIITNPSSSINKNKSLNHMNNHNNETFKNLAVYPSDYPFDYPQNNQSRSIVPSKKISNKKELKPSNNQNYSKAKINQWPPPNSHYNNKSKMTKAQYELIYGSINPMEDVAPNRRWIESIIRK